MPDSTRSKDASPGGETGDDPAHQAGDLAETVQTPLSDSLKRSNDGYFQCGYCKRHYDRADHLIRHVRSHTREKPYGCHICNKGFARPDLLKRHSAGHMQQRDGKRKRRSIYANNGRVTQACTSCAASKLKCDEEKPCRRCREKDWTCHWPQDEASINTSSESNQQKVIEETNFPSPVNGQVGLAHEHADLPTGYMASDSPQEVGAHHVDPTSSRFTASEIVIDNLPSYDELNIPTQVSVASPVVGGPTLSSTSDHESGVVELDGAFFPDFLPDDFVLSMHRFAEMDAQEIYSNSYNTYGIAGYNMQSDFDLNDVDFGFIESFNEREVFQPSHPDMKLDDQPTDSLDTDSGIAIGAEAYHKSSLANWTPIHEDHGYADHANLSVPKSIDSPESPVFSEQKVLSESLSQSSRDLVFGMVLKNCQRANLTRIMSSFPSTGMLDSLLQHFFESHASQIDPWIHIPTFKPNGECPEILTALAAAGAVKSSIPTIRKLGYALMEIVRVQLPLTFENDNSMTRDLRLLQAYALIIDIGMWSGDRRRTEIAESFEQPEITMLRRALRFRRSLYPPIVLQHEEGHSLDRKWREWVELESFKRLVYHCFLHDSQASIALNVNPIISYAEVELPLPVTRELWGARTAAEWRDIYLIQVTYPDRLPSLSDALRDMSQLTAFQGRIDLQMTGLILLHGLSALISEYHRMKSISGGHSRHWHALVINSRRQELYEALQHFSMIYHEWHTLPAPLIVLVQEVTSMFLHMSLEDLQLFAGKEDKKAARRVYHNALEWINSADSRRAVWHAGQAIQASTNIPPGAFNGFPAIAVYYASLTLWSYGVVSRARDPGKVTRNPDDGLRRTDAAPIIYLNEPKTADVEKFIALGRGVPALKGSRDSTFLDDPNTIMHIGQEVLRSNRNDDALPPLVQSLCQLMHDLGKAAKARGSDVQRSEVEKSVPA